MMITIVCGCSLLLNTEVHCMWITIKAGANVVKLDGGFNILMT
jgi:hypothetical protein